MNDVTFPKWIKSQLESKGMTQADLVKSSGLSNAQISRIVNSHSQPTAESLILIARGLQLPANEVFQAAGLLPSATEITHLMERAIYYLSHLHPDDQERVVLYLEVLYNRYRLDGERP